MAWRWGCKISIMPAVACAFEVLTGILCHVGGERRHAIILRLVGRGIRQSPWRRCDRRFR